jgi:small neutral amino acid transporter SnatA (MarC family)
MSAWKWNIAGVMGGIVLLAASAAVLSAQHGTPNTTAESQASFSIGKLFTFLFLTLGPFKIFGPFAAMTQGCDRAFKSQLAFKGIVIAALGMLAAPPSVRIPCINGIFRSAHCSWGRASSCS